MGITAVLCLLIMAGIATDGSIWNGGWAWRAGGLAGVFFFAAVAVTLAYGAFWRQRRHIARLRSILLEQPQRVRSIRLLVAGAVPVAAWVPDDGAATRGLHIVVTEDTGATWVLPVSRPTAGTIVAALAERCPEASVSPPVR